MAGSVQENTGKEDMSAPLNGPEASATLLNRHFTRSGRDPLALAPFEERLLLGRVTRVPSSWGPGGLVKLARELKSQPAAAYLVQVAREHSEAAREVGYLTEEEHLTLVDELSWVLGRGMGWVGQDSGVWVGTVNLHHFCEPVTQRFDLAGLRQTCRCLLIAAAGRAAKEGRPHAHSLNWTNGAGFLVVSGIAYDSSRGVGILGSIAAMILGQSCLTLAGIAGRKPDMANAAAKQVVLGGLNNARERAANLPPTASVASSADSDRWQAQTQELLEEAIRAIDGKGTTSPYPTSPQPCQENEEWLDPISTFAEAVPSLKLPDLAARPEIRASLKAMGLNDPQKTAVLAAIASGESILAAGVPEAKAPSLKTALGAWSFHPNAQLMMGSAVSPFVAGPLKHRVHLPAGIPEDFVSSVIGAAARFGLPGAVPCVQQTEAPHQVVEESEPAGKAEADETESGLSVGPVSEAVIEADPPAVSPAEPPPLPVTGLIPGLLEPAQPVQEATSPEPESEAHSLVEAAVVEPLPTGDPGIQWIGGEDEPRAPETHESGEGGTAGHAELPEAAPIAAAQPVVSEEPQAEPPAEAESAEAAAAEELEDAPPVVFEESQAEPPVGPEAASAEEVEAVPDAAAPAVVFEESQVEPSVEDEAAQGEEPPSDPESLDRAPVKVESSDGTDGGHPEPDSQAMPEELPPVLVSDAALDLKEAEASEPQPEKPAAQPGPILTVLEEPRVILTPCAWSRSLKIASNSGVFTVHAVKDDEGSPLSIGVTAASLPPLSRALLDASLAAINLGLAKGITVQEYRGAITEPSLMRDILAAVSKLVEER